MLQEKIKQKFSEKSRIYFTEKFCPFWQIKLLFIFAQKPPFCNISPVTSGAVFATSTILTAKKRSLALKKHSEHTYKCKKKMEKNPKHISLSEVVQYFI